MYVTGKWVSSIILNFLCMSQVSKSAPSPTILYLCMPQVVVSPITTQQLNNMHWYTSDPKCASSHTFILYVTEPVVTFNFSKQ